MYVASIKIDGTQPTIEEPAEFETCREAWEYIAMRMKEEAEAMYPEKEPDELAVVQIMSSPQYWDLAQSTAMQEAAATFFVTHGFGPDGTGNVLADGLMYSVLHEEALVTSSNRDLNGQVEG